MLLSKLSRHVWDKANFLVLTVSPSSKYSEHISSSATEENGTTQRNKKSRSLEKLWRELLFKQRVLVTSWRASCTLWKFTLSKLVGGVVQKICQKCLWWNNVRIKHWRHKRSGPKPQTFWKFKSKLARYLFFLIIGVW